jgi:hypothetical protein
MSTVDRNRTIWQRIQDRCEPTFGRDIADQIATLLLPYVNAERLDVSERAGSFVPLHVFGEVSVVGLNDCDCANRAPLDCGSSTIGRAELQCSFGSAHVSP